MGRVILQTGACAETPYCFERLDIRVYSIEELCYILRENAVMVDREILDRRLVRWIEEECKLPDLAAYLYPLLHQKTSVGAFAEVIFSYVGLYDKGTIQKTREQLNRGAGLDTLERQKTKIDMMAENGKLKAAYREYEALLESLPEGKGMLRASILQNEGVVLSGLFLFREAAEKFRQAHELDGDSETEIAYFIAMRLSMSEAEYISFVAGLGERYEITLEVERRMQELSGQYEKSAEKRALEERAAFKQSVDRTAYYEETGRMLHELKKDYREKVNG